MSAAKGTTKKKTTAKATVTEEAAPEITIEEIRLKYDPVMVALSKAEAARCLLVKNHEGLFDDDDTVDWVESFGQDAPSEALEEAKAAYVKAVAQAVVDKQAPAAEPA